jgi:hypothetical protein
MTLVRAEGGRVARATVDVDATYREDLREVEARSGEAEPHGRTLESHRSSFSSSFTIAHARSQ